VKHIQEALAFDLEILEKDLLVICREYNQWAGSQKAIDILAIDRDGNLVVIELKRGTSDKTPDLQAIRYAGMVSVMSRSDIISTYQDYQKLESFAEAEAEIAGFLISDENEYNLGMNVRIFLVAQDFSNEVVATVLWLNSQGLDVSCYTLSPYKHGEDLILLSQRLIPLREAGEWQDKFVKKGREAREGGSRSWNNEYYLSLWADFRWDIGHRYSFVAAGGGTRYSRGIRRLPVGARVWINWIKHGYVAVGTVESKAVPGSEFTVITESGEQFLADIAPFGKELAKYSGTDKEFYAVRINWLHADHTDHVKYQAGLYGNQNVVCRPKDPKWEDTISALKKRWKLTE